MADTLFTKIIKGEIPCYKIYEDERTFVFLDIYPLLPGHMLVVSKRQTDQLDDLPAEDYTALFATVKKVSSHAKRAMSAKRAIVQILGYDIPHVHVHVIPSDSGKAYYEAIETHLRQGEVQASDRDLEAMSAKLRLEDEV